MKEKSISKAITAVCAVSAIVLVPPACCGNTAGTEKNTTVTDRSLRIGEGIADTAQAEEVPKLYYTGIEEYRVQAFDTLSDIAVRFIPSDAYMQQWIDDVKALNNRKSSTIYFDEVIKVYVCE